MQPGNILVQMEPGSEDLDRTTLWLLDFGQMGKLTLREGFLLRRFKKHCEKRNITAMMDDLKAMAQVSPGKAGEAALKGDLESIVSRWSGSAGDATDSAVEIFRACHRRGLQIAIPFLRLLKGLITFEAAAETVLSPEPVEETVDSASEAESSAQADDASATVVAPAEASERADDENSADDPDRSRRSVAHGPRSKKSRAVSRKGRVLRK
jgi:predicted unusual protein kinase regulating ubiquinone biosynthesis (AarF/ABC1/UbiB family)